MLISSVLLNQSCRLFRHFLILSGMVELLFCYHGNDVDNCPQTNDDVNVTQSRKHQRQGRVEEEHENRPLLLGIVKFPFYLLIGGDCCEDTGVVLTIYSSRVKTGFIEAVIYGRRARVPMLNSI